MQLDRDRKNIIAVWRSLGEYDPADARFAGITKEAERLGVTLAPYLRGAKPPPRFTHTGLVMEYVKDEESGEYYARPVSGATEQPLPQDTPKVPNAAGLLPAQVQTGELTRERI